MEVFEMTDELNKAIAKTPPEVLRTALRLMLKQHISPVFGAAKIVEHEIAALNALQAIDFVGPDPDDFDLMERLGISRAKARSLLLQQALRSQPSLDQRATKIKQLLSQLKFHDQKNDSFMIEVSDPYMLEVLKKEIRKAGQISIATLSPSVISISHATIPVLFDRLLDGPTKREALRRYNAEHGEHLKDFQEVVTSLFGALASTVGGKPAEIIAKKVTGKTISWLFEKLRQ